MKPDFVGDHWGAPQQGLTFLRPFPADILRTGRLDDRNPWITLLLSFEGLKRGDFNHLDILQRLALTTNADAVRNNALRLIGHAGTPVHRMSIAEFYSHPSLETREAAYWASLYAADLRLIPKLLAAMKQGGRDERLTIMGKVSQLLEPETNGLFDDCESMSSIQYDAKATLKSQQMVERYGARVAILDGDRLDIAALLAKIIRTCSAEDPIELSGTLSIYFDFLEAMTGVSTAGLFNDDMEVDAFSALDLVQEFRESSHPERFSPGVRYFFGNQVPE